MPWPWSTRSPSAASRSGSSTRAARERRRRTTSGPGRRPACRRPTRRRGSSEGGAFHPERMIDALCAAIDEAVSDGFRGLCATGDMRWELASDENFDKLLEYEARLERVFREKPLMGICQYNRDTVPAHAVQSA